MRQLTSLTVIVNVGDVVVFAVGMKPESNPVWPLVLETPRGVHGSANELCVAVWFLSRNWNWTTSPSATPVSLGGVVRTKA